MTSKVETPSKITDHFPPSPKGEDDTPNSTESCKHNPTISDGKGSTTLPDKVPDKSIDPLSESSVLMTPKTSPNKNEDDEGRPNTKAGLKKDGKHERPEDTKVGGDMKDKSNDAKDQQVSAVPSTGTIKSAPKSRKKGRRKKGGNSAQSSGQSDAVINGHANAKSAKTKSSMKDTLLTDYYPVRRSDRRNKSEIEKEKEKTLQFNIQNGVEDGLKVEDIDDKGRGVVATKPFKRGDFVVEYAGDLIDLAEAKQRDEKYTEDPSKGCYMYYFNFKNKNYCIDATEESGKLGRLLNHSKTASNCHTKLVECDGRPYLILVASRDITVGEELQYDYGDRSKASIESHPWLKS